MESELTRQATAPTVDHPLCERCEARMATDRLQRALGGVDVGQPLEVCEPCSSELEGVTVL